MQRIRKGDEVVVITGRDKGKKGEVIRMAPKEDRAWVAGINMVKRHQKPAAGKPGGIEEKEAPIHVSNLAHEDPKDGKPTRVGFKIEGDKKVRVAKTTGEVING